jgi:plasmid stability protein
VAQVIIRNLDEDVVLRLKERARDKGCSLEHELRRIVTEAAGPTPEEKLAIARRIRAMTPKGVKQIEGWRLVKDSDRA